MNGWCRVVLAKREKELESGGYKLKITFHTPILLFEFALPSTRKKLLGEVRHSLLCRLSLLSEAFRMEIIKFVYFWSTQCMDQAVKNPEKIQRQQGEKATRRKRETTFFLVK